MDLVVANQNDHTLTLLRGDGKGGLGERGEVAAGENPTDLALADFDGDRHLDIAVANHDTDYLTILLGDGRGGFRPASDSPLEIEVDPHPHAVRTRDFNHDGHMDLAVDHRDGHGALILAGRGDGGFEPGKLVDLGGDPYRGMAFADFNGDGRLDISAPLRDRAAIVMGREARKLEFAEPMFLQADSPFAVGLGDLTGDGFIDVLSGSEQGSSVQLFEGDGKGSFSPSEMGFPMAPGAKKIATGDFNGDGVDDAAVANYSPPQVILLLGSRDKVETLSLAGGETPWGLTFADLDEDGRDELLVADYSNPQGILHSMRGK